MSLRDGYRWSRTSDLPHRSHRAPPLRLAAAFFQVSAVIQCKRYDSLASALSHSCLTPDSPSYRITVQDYDLASADCSHQSCVVVTPMWITADVEFIGLHIFC